jgi:hypothetical protein
MQMLKLNLLLILFKKIQPTAPAHAGPTANRQPPTAN